MNDRSVQNIQNSEDFTLLQDANGSIGLTSNGIEKMPIELIQEEVIIKIASGSDHLTCLTDKGELLTMGK